jgi:hypothetical protein
MEAAILQLNSLFAKVAISFFQKKVSESLDKRYVLILFSYILSKGHCCLCQFTAINYDLNLLNDHLSYFHPRALQLH